jgi:hypothetical protein
MEVPRFSTGIIRVFLGEVGQRPRFAADDCRQIVKNLVRFHASDFSLIARSLDCSQISSGRGPIARGGI